MHVRVHVLRSHNQRDGDRGVVQGTSVSRSSLARAGNAQIDTSLRTRSFDESQSHVAMIRSDDLDARSQVSQKLRRVVVGMDTGNFLG